MSWCARVMNRLLWQHKRNDRLPQEGPLEEMLEKTLLSREENFPQMVRVHLLSQTNYFILKHVLV